MKKSQIKPIQGSTILLIPFSKEFVSKDYLNWMNDAETTRFIQKAKNNTSIDELYSFVNENFILLFEYLILSPLIFE